MARGEYLYDDGYEDAYDPPSAPAPVLPPEEQYDIQALVKQLINERGGETGLDASTYQTLLTELTTAYQRQRSNGADHQSALNYVRGTLPASYIDPVAPPPPVSTGGGVGAGVGGGGNTNAVDPTYLAPWTEAFKSPSDAALPQYQAPSPFSYQDFQAPGDFKPPTAADILKDPSYLWREGRTRDSIENSAAARGLLGSSGTLWDIGSAVGNLASQEYGQIYNRDYDVWNDNYGRSLDVYTTNRNNAVNNYATNYGVGKDTYNLLTDRSQDVYKRAWDVFQDRKKTFYDNQNNAFDKLHKVLTIGSLAAGG